jgi:hypothetical protein
VALVFGVQVASEADDDPQANAVPQGAGVSTSNPCEDRRAPDMGVSLGGGKRNEVPKDTLDVSQLETNSSTSGEVGIGGCTQHDATSGQG